MQLEGITGDYDVEIPPEAALVQIVGRYMQLGDLRPDPEMSKQSLLEEVKRFDAAARASRYYESFSVNSKNCMDKSAGTVAFIANFTRLLDRSVTASSNGDRAEVRVVMETLFALHRYIDECNDDVIFFADEGGAWQICVDWHTVLPAWFRCLARTADALEFARLVDETIEEFDPQSRSMHLATAGRLANAPQRRILTARGSSRCGARSVGRATRVARPSAALSVSCKPLPVAASLTGGIGGRTSLRG